MARLTLGMWTTHGPILNTTADEWLLRVPFDKRIDHWYKGELYSFDQLVELRRAEDMVTQSSAEEREKRHARCQKDVERMAELWEQHKPDVAIILGNDQRELIRDSLQPMFSIYHGETFWQKPLDESRAAKLGSRRRNGLIGPTKMWSGTVCRSSPGMYSIRRLRRGSISLPCHPGPTPRRITGTLARRTLSAGSSVAS